jgi:aminoglycoside/choline kinase family phosphotransferase
MRLMAVNPEPPRSEPDTRLEQARDWLRSLFDDIDPDWRPITGDASFRRYFRVRVGGTPRVLMDAPPDIEDSGPFVDIAERLRTAGLHAPRIIASNLEAGFILEEDLGDELFRDLVTPQSAGALFDAALGALAVMANKVSPDGLPAYDRGLYARELGWFTGFYLGRHRGQSMARGLQSEWQRFCEALIESALEQPQVFVHKDVHSNNLLRTPRNSPGIIDFQDAVRGPLTYDFASLVWDRYITWPRDRLEGWMEQFRQLAAPTVAGERWVRWCDLMGLQRNLKIVGRFALLRYQQHKHGYVEMIPRFYGYVVDTLRRYPEFGAVREWLEGKACAP